MEFVSVINILSCLCALSILFLLANEITATGEVVFAVNCGGPDHTDLNGVHYQADKLGIGTPSDFGRQLTIGRVPPLDQILYQTERYHLSNFAYDIPIKEDGDYVLVLKFSEVYFQGPKLKVIIYYLYIRGELTGGGGLLCAPFQTFTNRDTNFLKSLNFWISKVIKY